MSTLSSPPSSKQPLSKATIGVVNVVLPQPGSSVPPFNNPNISSVDWMIRLSDKPEEVPRQMLQQARTNVQTVIASVQFLKETRKTIEAKLQGTDGGSDVSKKTAQLEELGTWVQASEDILKQLRNAHQYHKIKEYFPEPEGLQSVASRYHLMATKASNHPVGADMIAWAKKGWDYTARSWNGATGMLHALSDLSQCATAAYQDAINMSTYTASPGLPSSSLQNQSQPRTGSRRPVTASRDHTDAASQSFRKEGTEPVSHTFAHPIGARSETASFETVKPDSSKPSGSASGSDATDKSEEAGEAATVSKIRKQKKSFSSLRGIFNRAGRTTE